jgi:NAD(P)-dependent dehydrogenase (short-subunit alcohol dehydrogenase family)
MGACEEQTDYELRSQFETNVYGTFNVIRKTLPLLRGRDSARYINLTSTSNSPANSTDYSWNNGGTGTWSVLCFEMGY